MARRTPIALALLFALTLAACSSGGTTESTSSPASTDAEVIDDGESVPPPTADPDVAPDTTEAAAEEASTDTEPGTASITPSLSEDFPDIIAVQATRESGGTWRFDVTVSSPYDTPQRYADAWRVLDPEGNELGIRILTHDHANEQPFTRSQTGIAIPDDITEVTVQGRDQANGWGGGELVVALPTS